MKKTAAPPLPVILGTSKEYFFTCPNCGGHNFGNYALSKLWQKLIVIRTCHGGNGKPPCGWEGRYENEDFNPNWRKGAL